MTSPTSNSGSQRLSQEEANIRFQALEAQRSEFIPPSHSFNPRGFHEVQAAASSTSLFNNAASSSSVGQLFPVAFPQTDLQSAVGVSSPLTEHGKTVVKNINRRINKLMANTEMLGSAVLLNKNYILAPRHCIEGRLVNKMSFMLGERLIKCDYIVEDDAELDYAIIKISELTSYSQLEFSRAVPEHSLLLHYPVDGDLAISGNFKTLENVEHMRVDDVESVSHDSDSGSSGGIYVDSEGKVFAIHLGTDINDDYSMSAMMGTGSADRYILPINLIVLKNLNSVLLDLNYDAPIRGLRTVPLTSRLSSWEREGYKSQLKFTQLLEAKKDLSTVAKQKKAGVTKTKRDVVSFKDIAKVAELKGRYPVEMAQTIDFSLGQAALHGVTNEYSIAGEIESDHPLPYDVWARTNNPRLNKVVADAIAKKKSPQKPRERPGEDNMPAITIPYTIHRSLKTTGSSPESNQFRDNLVTKCDSGDIPGALADVIGDYSADPHNLVGPKATDPRYKASWTETLELYEAMAIITAAEKSDLLKLL